MTRRRSFQRSPRRGKYPHSIINGLNGGNPGAVRFAPGPAHQPGAQGGNRQKRTCPVLKRRVFVSARMGLIIINRPPPLAVIERCSKLGRGVDRRVSGDAHRAVKTDPLAATARPIAARAPAPR